MLKSRIIPILLLRKGRMVKGINFDSYRDVGDPVSAVRIYNAQNVDELVFLDIDATAEGRNTHLDVIERVSEEAFVPMTVGGGVKKLSDMERLLKSGADKVAINTAAIETPQLIQEGAKAFGRQCVCVSIDVKKGANGYYEVWSHSGAQKTDLNLEDHIKNMEDLGAGEILLNSIDRDGTKSGYDHELIQVGHDNCSLPIIIAGGSGNLEHLQLAIQETNVSGVGCCSVFYFADNNPIRARSHMRQHGIPMRNV